MDFSRRKVKVLSPEEGELAELYPHDLQMYTSPPVCEISLSEFEQLAVDRLKGKISFNILSRPRLVNKTVT